MAIVGCLFSLVFYCSPGPGREDTEHNQELVYFLLLCKKKVWGGQRKEGVLGGNREDKKEEVKEGRPHRKLLTQGPLGVWMNPSFGTLGHPFTDPRELKSSIRKSQDTKPILTQENTMHAAAVWNTKCSQGRLSLHPTDQTGLF